MGPGHKSGSGGGGNFEQNRFQSSFQNRNPFQHHQFEKRETQLLVVEPDLSPEQAEELRKKRLERFGPVEPAEPTTTHFPGVGDSNTVNTADANKKSGEGAQASTSGAPNKVQIRCKHWPKCNKTEAQCEFVHPKDDCKFFPKCTYGDKCLFIHPEISCKFGDSCQRLNCAYKHSSARIGHHRGAAQSMIYNMKPFLMMAAQGMMHNPSMFINNFNANTTTTTPAPDVKKDAVAVQMSSQNNISQQP